MAIHSHIIEAESAEEFKTAVLRLAATYQGASVPLPSGEAPVDRPPPADPVEAAANPFDPEAPEDAKTKKGKKAKPAKGRTKAFTVEDCKKAGQAVIDNYDLPKLKEVIALFNVERISVLKAEQFEKFIEKCNQVVAEATDQATTASVM